MNKDKLRIIKDNLDEDDIKIMLRALIRDIHYDEYNIKKIQEDKILKQKTILKISDVVR